MPDIDEIITAVHHGDTRPFIENLLTIPTKSGHLAPFKLNRLQRYMHKTRTGRDYWLKFRQGGSSVYHLADLFARTVTIPYFTAAVITLSTDNGRQKRLMFNHVERYLKALPEEFRPNVSHQTEEYLEFGDLESQMLIGTVGSNQFARGVTLNALMVTELGSYTPGQAQSVLTSAIESVVPGGLIVFETTPLLLGSPAHVFYEECRRGEKPYHAEFLPWYTAEDYYLPEGSNAALTVDRGLLELTTEEIQLSTKFPLDGIPVTERIRWRRSKQAERGKDFASEYPEDEASCWLSATHTVFPMDKLKSMLEEQREPYDIKLDTRYYKSFDSNRSYTIGIDAAAGVTGGDYSAGVVQNVQTGDVVAVIHGHISPKVFARQLCELALEYGQALVGGERDAWTMQVMDEMEDLGYPNVYYHEEEGVPKKGFPNTNQSRAAGVTALLEALRQNDFVTYDRQLIAELTQYAKTPSEKQTGIEMYAAPKGLHDDLCVASQRSQQMRETVPAQKSFSLDFSRSNGVELVIEYPSNMW